MPVPPGHDAHLVKPVVNADLNVVKTGAVAVRVVVREGHATGGQQLTVRELHAVGETMPLEDRCAVNVYHYAGLIRAMADHVFDANSSASGRSADVGLLHSAPLCALSLLAGTGINPNDWHGLPRVGNHIVADTHAAGQAVVSSHKAVARSGAASGRLSLERLRGGQPHQLLRLLHCPIEPGVRVLPLDRHH